MKECRHLHRIEHSAHGINLLALIITPACQLVEGGLQNILTRFHKFHFRCDGVSDCPVTEISNGGEDEEGCEGSGDFDVSLTDLRTSPRRLN